MIFFYSSKMLNCWIICYMLIVQENGAFCINVKQKCFKFKRKHMELQTEKKVKRARDTLTRTLSRTIFMFNLFVKWEYTSANNNQQSHIWNRHRATTIITQREPASWANHGRTLIRTLVRIEARARFACVLKDDWLFSRIQSQMIYIVLCQFFFFGELCWKQNNVHSIEIVYFFFFIFT